MKYSIKFGNIAGTNALFTMLWSNVYHTTPIDSVSMVNIYRARQMLTIGRHGKRLSTTETIEWELA